MRLDRMGRPDGRQKYALINWRKFDELMGSATTHPRVRQETAAALEWLINQGIAEHGSEFFVVKYKDVFAAGAMQGYVNAVDAFVRDLEHRERTEQEEKELAEFREYLCDLVAELHKATADGRRLPT